MHNSHRIDSKNNGTFNKVMKTIELFNKFKVEYNILYVVTAQSSRYANKIYDFFKKNNFRYIQFISCLEPLNEDKRNYPYSLYVEVLAQERDTFGEEGIGLNYYCSAYKAFFDYAYTRMLNVARLI